MSEEVIDFPEDYNPKEEVDRLELLKDRRHTISLEIEAITQMLNHKQRVYQELTQQIERESKLREIYEHLQKERDNNNNSNNSNSNS